MIVLKVIFMENALIMGNNVNNISLLLNVLILHHLLGNVFTIMKANARRKNVRIILGIQYKFVKNIKI